MSNSKKKAIFFSADALIALGIILIIIIVAYPLLELTNFKTNVHEDTIKVLSSLKIGEIDNNQVKGWINSSLINDTNKYIVEQIGEFYVNDPAKARALAQIILDETQSVDNMGIWYDGVLLASKNVTSYENATKVNVARQTISGIGGLQEGSVTGYSARAYLTKNIQTSYFYFGGYDGDGNISILINYNGTILNASMELAINDNFNLFLNGLNIANYSKSPNETTPVKYSILTNNFAQGTNTLEFRGVNLHVAGGFVKITFEQNASLEESNKHYLPGIDGLINIYDGFYVPGNLTNLDISLHINNSFLSFFNIGNVTIFNSTTNGEQTILINDTFLKTNLNYSQLSKKTIPLRFGLENVSLLLSSSKIDLFSVTDLSGSMDDNCPGGSANPGETPCGINDAKTGNNALINIILSYSGNRVSLIGYESLAKISDFHTLSTNRTSLNNTVYNIWDASGNTCICCGILKIASCYNSSIFSDNFNSQNVGSNPIGWSLSESGGFVDITNYSLEGNRSVVINRTSSSGSNNPLISHDFYQQDVVHNIEFLVNHTSASGRFRLRIQDYTGSSNNDYIIFKMYGGQMRNGDTAITSYNLNTKYKLKLEIDPSTDRYNLYVNDILNQSNLAVYDSGRSNVGRIIFTTESGITRYVLDDIKVYLNSATCASIGNNTRSAVVMSDGQANIDCGMDPMQDYDLDGDTSNDPDDHAIGAACMIKNSHNVTLNAVAFGSGADEDVMQKIAQCGGGSYYYSDVNDLVAIYNQIANNILQSSYNEQTINANGSFGIKLYPDSYIKYEYTSEPTSQGLYLTQEKQFDSSSTGNFSLPQNSSIVDVKVISYSGPKWTDEVFINNTKVYDLSIYGSDYIKLGDPYAINIPNSYIGENNYTNIVKLTLANSPTNTSNGSLYNKIIYKFTKDFAAYSGIVPKLEGCNWSIQFEDYSNLTLKVPYNYFGSDNCVYNFSFNNTDDAAKISTFELFKALDFDLNEKIDYKFSESDLQIDLTQTSGIPFVKTNEIQVRVWR